MHWPRVNGRRYLGACGTYDQAVTLARLYKGTIEQPGIRLSRDEEGRYRFGGLLEGWYSVFIDPRPFGESTSLKVDIDHRGVNVTPTPSVLR